MAPQSTSRMKIGATWNYAVTPASGVPYTDVTQNTASSPSTLTQTSTRATERLPPLRTRWMQTGYPSPAEPPRFLTADGLAVFLRASLPAPAVEYDAGVLDLQHLHRNGPGFDEHDLHGCGCGHNRWARIRHGSRRYVLCAEGHEGHNVDECSRNVSNSYNVNGMRQVLVP
jgi:hypothetical protein